MLQCCDVTSEVSEVSPHEESRNESVLDNGAALSAVFFVCYIKYAEKKVSMLFPRRLCVSIKESLS